MNRKDVVIYTPIHLRIWQENPDAQRYSFARSWAMWERAATRALWDMGWDAALYVEVVGDSTQVYERIVQDIGEPLGPDDVAAVEAVLNCIGVQFVEASRDQQGA